MDKVYIQDKIQAIISKYEKLIKDTINPSHFTKWSEVGFDEEEAPSGCKTIEDFLEGDNLGDDECAQVSLRHYRKFLDDIYALVEKDSEDI